jgi:hypothetical protein
VFGGTSVRVRIREMGGIDARSGPDCLGMSGNLTLLTNVYFGIHRGRVRAVSTAYRRTGRLDRATSLV